MLEFPIYLRACQVLSQYGVHTLPVRLAPIFERSGIHWFDYQAYADSLSISSAQVGQQYGADGFTNYINGDYMVFYNPAQPPARMRFTLAHELGHIFLGHIGSLAPLCKCTGSLTLDQQAGFVCLLSVVPTAAFAGAACRQPRADCAFVRRFPALRQARV